MHADSFAVRYIDGPLMPRTTADRFIDRVYAVLDDRGIPQKEIRGSNSEGWISNKLKGRRQIKLDEAADIAHALQFPLTELLRKPDERVYELDNTEARLMEAFRQLSTNEQEACLTLLTLRQRQAPHATGRNIAKKARTGSAREERGRIASARPAAELSQPVQRLVAAFEKETSEHAPEARRQAPATRPDLPVASARDRKVRGSGLTKADK